MKKFRLIGYRLMLLEDEGLWRDAPEHFGRVYPCRWNEKTLSITQVPRNWFGHELEGMLRREADVGFRFEGDDVGGRVVHIINTLDPIYGHALYKAASARSFIKKNPSAHVVVLCTRNIKQLLGGAKSFLVVDGPPSQLRAVTPRLEVALQQLVGESERAFFVFGQGSRMNDSAQALPAEMLDAYPSRERREVVFVIRRDRCWGGFAVWQDLRAAKVVRAVRKKWPHLSFSKFQIGRPTGRGGSGFDFFQAVDQPSADFDRRLLDSASRAIVVFGVHGSHLLLPTALAWGCLEIIPENRLGNYGQAYWPDARRPALDIAYSYRVLHGDRFLFLPTARTVAKHLSSLIETYNALRLRRCDEDYLMNAK